MELRPEKTVTIRDSDNEDRLYLSQWVRQTRENDSPGKVPAVQCYWGNMQGRP